MPFSYSSDNTIPPLISIKEMLSISLNISQSFAPTAPIKTNTSKENLSSSELLKVSQNISQYYSSNILSNIKNLTILAINPHQLYIYWNLGINNSPSLLPSIFNNELMLRIYSQPEKDSIHTDSKLVFEEVIHDFQHQKKTSVPIAKSSLIYSAYIGNPISDKGFTPIMKSNELHLLKGNESPSFFPDEPIHLTNINFINPMKTSSSTPTNTPSSYASSNRSGRGKKSLNNE